MKGRVLVPGGAGLYWLHIVRGVAGCRLWRNSGGQPFRTGSQVRCTCAGPRFEFIYDDVRDESILSKALKNVDVIVPTAAVVGAPACDRDSSLPWSVNVEAVRLLAELRSE
jgi:nucleoside-diphosphate-sugar epimerase